MNNILVIYVGVAGIRSEDISDYINKVAARITPVTFEGEIIYLPAQSYDTRIECVNPVYITEEQLIQENTLKIKKLNEELQFQIEQLKLNKNG
jgi:hypothetical protein